ncbi:MAG: type VI secretion system contractile sheath small subunit [Candidatus Dactylopiibacterium sp.]|nr:type VI secretion system contractile sheath small subunit [Candidatus Dactylopiibacterium sp.]
MAESFQNEVPAARVNIKLDLHTGGAQKKVELPLKLMVLGDFSNGQDARPLADRPKVSINKNNFDAVLGELNPRARITVENTLAGDGSEMQLDIDFRALKDFAPDRVARQIPQLSALMAMRNLLRDLKSNLLDNASFRRELERILKDPTLSASLRAELENIAPVDAREA